MDILVPVSFTSFATVNQIFSLPYQNFSHSWNPSHLSTVLNPGSTNYPKPTTSTCRQIPQFVLRENTHRVMLLVNYAWRKISWMIIQISHLKKLKQACSINKILFLGHHNNYHCKQTCVHNGRSLPCRESLWFSKGNLPRNVNIKKMYLKSDKYIRNYVETNNKEECKMTLPRIWNLLYKVSL